MSYILIMFAAGFSDPAIATAQFETEQLCIEAGNRVRKEVSARAVREYNYICVQSSLIDPPGKTP